MLLDKIKRLIPFFFVLLLGLIPLLWFKNNSIAAGHDMGYSLTPLTRLLNRFFTWSDAMSLGQDGAINVGSIAMYLPEALLQFFGLPVRLGQILVFMYWFSLPGLSMFFLLKTILHHTKFLQRFDHIFLISGSLFYSLNHYLLQGWFVASKQEFSLVVVTPILIALMINVTSGIWRPINSAIIGALLLTLFNANGAVAIPILAGLFITVFWFFLYFLLSEKEIKKRKFFFRSFGLFIITLGLFFVLFNSYWILPFIFYSLNHYGSEVALAGGVTGVSGWVEIISKYATFSNLFRLQGFSGWYDIQNHPYSKTFLENPVFILMSFLWPAFILFSLKIKTTLQTKLIIGFFFGLALIAIFFMSGTRSPLGFIYKTLLFIPGFTAIRTPFYKFGYLLWLSYSVLFAFSATALLSYITSYVKNSWLKPILGFLFSLVLILSVAVYNYPFFKATFFVWDSPLSTMITPPEYVFDFQRWIENQKTSGRILLYPRLINGNADVYIWNYWSLTPFPNLLSEESIVSDSIFLNGEQTKIINQLYRAIEKKDEFTIKRLANILDIKYILLRKDVRINEEGNLSKSPSYYAGVLEDSSWFISVKSFGEWTLYSLGNQDSDYEIALKRSLVYASDTDSLSKYLSAVHESSVVVTSQKAIEIEDRLVDADISTGACATCNLDFEVADFKIPQPLILPASPFYNLIRLRESVNLFLARKDQRRTSLFTGYIARRLGETESIAVTMKKTDNNFAYSRYSTSSKKLLDDIISMLKETYEIRKRNTAEEPINFSYNLYMESFIISIEGKITSVESLLPSTPEYLSKFEIIHNLLKDLETLGEKNFWRTSSENSLKYLVNPSRQQKYAIYLKPEGNINYENLFEDRFTTSRINFSDSFATRSAESVTDLGYSFGSMDILPGVQRISVSTPSYKNLLSTNTVSIPAYGDSVYITVSEIIENQDYLLQFHYKENTIRDVHIKAYAVNEQGNKITFPAKPLTPKSEKNQRILLKTPESTQKIILKFDYNDPQNKSFPIEITETKLHPLINPTLLLIALQDNNRNNFTPEKITYSKLTKTFYLFKEPAEKESFFVLLKQGYSPGWNMFVVPENIPFKNCSTLFCLSFKETFLSFFGKRVDATNHMIANGYSNVWFVQKNDFSNKEYAIVYKPQFLFWIGSVISIFSIIIVIGTTLFIKISRIKK